MLYFKDISIKLNKKRELIKERKQRKYIYLNKQLNLGKKFTRGDILTLNFWAKSCYYHFEGICLSLKKKQKMINANTTIKLRNILYNVGIEVCISYFYNRLFINTFMSDYKRKKFIYRASKLYYLCEKKNKATRIKA